MNVILVAKENYEEIQRYNIELRKESPWLFSFYWPCWAGLLPEKRNEQIEYIQYIIENKIKQIDGEHRHNFAIEKMIESGWKLGRIKKTHDINFNGERIPNKTDPFLIPWEFCPDYFKYWGESRDRITEKNTKDFI